MRRARIGTGAALLTATGFADEEAFGHPRDFLKNQFVYLVISPRARGLSVGVNVNPVARCNLNCVYCEVDRKQPARAPEFDVDRMADELRSTLLVAKSGWLRQQPYYSNLPADLLEIRHVALSGDGEPTLSDHFVEAVQGLISVRAAGDFFKIVLITNSTALDQVQAQEGLELLISEDEVWAKLDGGTQAYLNKVNGPNVTLERVLGNILAVARKRPVVIQSLFPAVNGKEPSAADISEYAQRLKELRVAGAKIPLVQIYSATRPMARAGCTHLPLKSLKHIAQTVRKISGLRAEVF